LAVNRNPEFGDIPGKTGTGHNLELEVAGGFFLPLIAIVQGGLASWTASPQYMQVFFAICTWVILGD